MAPKVKKPLTAKAKAKLRAAKLAAKAAAAAEGGEGEAPSSPKPMKNAFKLKVIKSLGNKTVEEASKEYKEKSQQANAQLHELEAVVAKKVQTCEAAQGEYDKAKAAIEAAMQAEVASANEYKESVGKRSEFTKKVEDARKDLFEAQRKVAMMEVLAVNHAKMKMLDEQRKAAQKAAEDAKKNMIEQRQREKEALEATKRALAEARAAQKGFGKGVKKQMGEAAVHPDLAETMPADID